MIKLMESSLPNNYVQGLRTIGLDFDPKLTYMMYEVTMYAIADFLRYKKSKENKSAVVFKDMKGNVILTGIVEYHANENEDMPGNWSFEISFNEEDIKDAVVYLATDNEFQRVLTYAAGNLHGFRFKDPTTIAGIAEKVITTLTNWLDVNAKNGEVVEIAQEGYFVASVSIEDGVKVFSIDPDGALKVLVKDDAVTESK